MGKRLAERLEDDYFAEPDYDRMTDDELDELYNFGELSAKPKRRKAGKKVANKKTSRDLLRYDESDWADLDFDTDDYYDEE